MNQKTYTLEEAQAALERYCSYQERTHRDVETKLQKMGMIEMASEKIILSLMQNNFLNEERYARSFARGKFRINKWGKLKIRQALQQKGVSKANILLGLSEIDLDAYLETIKELIQKQSPKIKAKNTFEKKQKMIRYLQQKGFEMGVFYELLEED